MESVLRRLAYDRRAEGIGNDQTGVERKDIARHLKRSREKQPITMPAIIHPLLVSAKVSNRRLDLDDPHVALGTERDQIGAPARCQRQFAHGREAKRMQKPRSEEHTSELQSHSDLV